MGKCGRHIIKNQQTDIILYMKILFINTLYPPNVIGGAEISVKFLAESMVKLGHEVTVLSLSPQYQKKINWIHGVKVYFIPLRNIYWPFNNSSLLARSIWNFIDICNPLMGETVKQIIKIEKPDIINTHNLLGFSISAWMCSKKEGIPIFHTLRDLYLLCPRVKMYHKNNICNTQCLECRIASFYKKIASSLVDGVIGISDYILEKHIQHEYFSKAVIKTVIPNSYIPDKIYKHKVSHIVRFGFLGRLNHSKGIEFALSSFKKLEHTNFEFYVAGRGDRDYEKKINKRFSDSRFFFLGFTEPSKFFPKIDVLIMPSLLHESFGRSIIEAFAHGVPVVGSNRGGIPQLIEDGITGYIFEPDKADSLLSILDKLINNPDLIINLKKNALIKSNYFLPEKIATQYLTIYNSNA